MNQANCQIPEGMQDTLPGECSRKRKVEQALRGLFARYGYEEIETPLLEYYNVMDDETFGFNEAYVWKTFDRRGRILAIRPDSTIPAVRMAASRLNEELLPLRLCYMQSAATYRLDTISALCEGTQAGVELMGEGGPDADAEIIALAIESLKAAGLNDFQLDVGQVAFFNGFMEEAGLSEKQAEKMARFVDDKNMLGMELYLKGEGLSDGIMQKLGRLTQLYGDESVLEEAEKMTKNAICLSAIENLKQVRSILSAYGLMDYISFDLGMVGGINYYSGMIFRGMTPHLGQPLLSGGRYDNLPAAFGREMPATGFALSLKPLMIALERQGEVFSKPQADIVLGFEREALKEAMDYAAQMRAEGKSVAVLYDGKRETAKAHLNAGKAKKAVYVTKEAVEMMAGGRA
jgi:ATP phosphoribosyltransferase, regulatory subunit